MNHRSLLALSLLVCLAMPSGCATVNPEPASPVAPADQITVTPPVIPDRTFNFADFGAVGDGITYNTDAFNKAVAAIAKAGGGHLNLPPGIYLTKSFVLTSHMDLHLEPGATIKASDIFSDYGVEDPNRPSTRPAEGGATTRPSRDGFRGRDARRSASRPSSRPAFAGAPTSRFTRTGERPGGGSYSTRRLPAFISGDGLTDVSITGGGTIDGSGQIFWIWSDKFARHYPPGRAIVPRPSLIAITGAERLYFAGITFSNAASAHLTFRGSDVLVENVRVVAPSDAPNTDAIRFTGERIIVRKSEIDIGDDNIAIGGGTHDVLMEDLTCLHGHGISIGSMTQAGLHHIFVRRCTFDGTDNGLRIKSTRGTGGNVHDIWYSDITMKNVRRPFDINMRYNGNANTNVDVGPRESDIDEPFDIPDFHDIHVTNLTITHCPIAGRIIGIPEQMPVRIIFTNVKFQTDRGFYVEDARDIVFNNAQMQAAIGEPLVTVNSHVLCNGAEKTGAGPSAPFYWGN